ncbi:MAG: bifunctional 5,6,7,8-tetrahydromethanopterin hydro-lyase/3-hexulose-6-phosphate synthase [Candidatus Atabeyarchaeum deiterrae]
MYLIGEALVGEGDELAHIDLIVGDKNGPVGQAFASSFSNLSAGHTPVLAVIRPNLPSKPFTLVVPKVTVKDLDQANRIFGPAQAAVAKAIADAVEEGIVPKDAVEDMVIIASVFVHPNASDYRKIYHYNYGATKLALKRALTGYPDLDKIMYEKDRAKHPIMGFKVPRLWRPPYLQIALDVPDVQRTMKVIEATPRSDRIILEAGTPLIKKYGASVIKELRTVAKDVFIVADLKTLDVGKVEVDIAYDQTADAVVASGLAAAATLDGFIYEAQKLGVYAMLDMMNVDDPIKKLSSLKELPDVVILHRSIDVERAGGEGTWNIKEIREAFKGKKILVAVAGGITPDKVAPALKQGADILIVGRYITQSKDIERSVREFITKLPESEIDLLREHVE